MDCCRLEITDWQNERWDSYVDQHPHGSIFHTRAMLQTFLDARDFDPIAHAAVDEHGKIVALLASAHVTTLRSIPSFASRIIQFAEPLCDATPCGAEALKHLLQLHAKQVRAKSLLSEVRSICQPGIEKSVLTESNYRHLDYINFVIDLRQSEQELWSKLNKRLRQKIRATFRRNVEIRDDNSLEGVERLYEMLRLSYGRAQVPLAGRDFFDATLANLPSESIRIRTAFWEGAPVASIYSLLYGKRVFSWYGGTRRLHGLSPFACLVWDDIEWGCKNGFEIYDFGGAGWPHEPYGPRRFKASFGGDEVRYGRYIMPHSQLRYRIAEFAFSVSRKLGVWSATHPD